MENGRESELEKQRNILIKYVNTNCQLCNYTRRNRILSTFKRGKQENFPPFVCNLSLIEVNSTSYIKIYWHNCRIT